MEPRRRCFSFEASGHEYRPLDGLGEVVCRLYCVTCGRVIPAAQEFNNESWAKVPLPTEIAREAGLTDESLN